MTELMTEAGRRLSRRLVGMQRDYYHVIDDILVIEQEAAAAREAEIRAAVEGLPPWLRVNEATGAAIGELGAVDVVDRGAVLAAIGSPAPAPSTGAGRGATGRGRSWGSGGSDHGATGGAN